MRATLSLLQREVYSVLNKVGGRQIVLVVAHSPDLHIVDIRVGAQGV